MEPSINDISVYYSPSNPKKQLRAHIKCLVDNNCSLTTVSFVAVNNNLARATFAVTQCTGTATSQTLMEADANITLAIDYTKDHETEFILTFSGGEEEKTLPEKEYKEG